MVARPLIARLLALALLVGSLGGCVRTVPPDATRDAISAFAAGGVTVSEDVTSQAPIVAPSGQLSAMRFTRWQVRNMLVEGSAHNGYRGEDLDALAQPPPGVPAFSTLIAAWLESDEGPLAQYAQQFITAADEQHAATMVFPTIVVLSFIADAARVKSTAQRPPPGIDFEHYIASPAQAEGICTDVSGWISSTVSDVYNAIQSNGDGFLSALWNRVVTLAGSALKSAIDTVLTPTLGVLVKAATAAAMLMQVTSLFKPWAVRLAADPASVVLDDGAHDGSFTATLDAESIDWPKTLVGCVSEIAGIALDDKAYANAPVTWSKPVGIPPGLASTTSSDTNLRDDKTAVYAYRTITSTKPPEDMCPRLVPDGTIGITVTIARSDITKVVSTLENLILNLVPATIRSYVVPFVQPSIDTANQAVGQFRAPSAHGSVSVSKYVEDPLCTHTPPPGPSAQPTIEKHAGTQPLPPGPCEGIVDASDVAAAFHDGSVLVPLSAEGKQGFATFGQAVNERAGVQSSRLTTASMCPIGIPGPKPDTGDMRGMFTVVPWQGVPGRTQSDHCRALMGAQLDHFGASCYESPGLVTITDGTTEYDMGTTQGGMDTTYAFLSHMFHRLAPN